jgi:hypothetical protein
MKPTRGKVHISGRLYRAREKSRGEHVMCDKMMERDKSREALQVAFLRVSIRNVYVRKIYELMNTLVADD